MVKKMEAKKAGSEAVGEGIGLLIAGILLSRKGEVVEIPFKSEAQRAWMYAKHPKMAKKWEAHTPKGAKLPKHVKKKK